MDQGFIPQGSEFLVNTYTSGEQRNSALAALDDGGYVVIWQSSDDQDGDERGIFGQRYDAGGTAVGAEFRVNSYTSYSQFDPSVTSLTDGGFIVSWSSYSQGGSNSSLFGQRYDAAGSTVGSGFQIYASGPMATTDNQQSSITSLSGGGFVVAWDSFENDGKLTDILGQRYDAAGTAIGSAFQINTHTISWQTAPSITGLENGGFVVAWQSDGQDGSTGGVYGQRYNAAGITVGAEFRINTYTQNSQGAASITSLPDGGFVVTWHSSGQDGDGYGIYGQRYDAAGTSAGVEFHISTHTAKHQINPSVTAMSDGGFVVLWQSEDQDGSSYGVYGQRFDVAGVAIGGEIQINTYTTNRQAAPAVTTLSNGSFVVSWQSYGQDGDERGVYAQQFAARLFGTSGDDTISDNVGANWIDGQAGNDTLYGRTGDDTLFGGDGADTLAGNGGDDTLQGGNDNDRLFGGAGDDLLRGGDGDDKLDGSIGADILSGNEGADLLYGREGNDTLFGGAGIDTLAGNAGADTLYGGTGDDRLFGGDGDDHLNGDAGADDLDAGLGADVLRGGDGDDVLYGRSGADTLAGNDGDDNLYGGNDNDQLFGGVGNDRLNGDAGDDVLRGGNDSDLLFGRGEVDTLAGNAGDDSLYGGGGNDRLFGGSGDDRLAGGSGSDSLTGGAGADEFVFETKAGLDTVQDFTDGTDLVRYNGGAYGDLTIVASGSDVDITSVDGGHMLLLDTAVADVTEADFVFG